MASNQSQAAESAPSTVECHPLEPFLPCGAKVLMLGSFPPSHQRWSMEFFYPNFQNDMWRIMGQIFFGDRHHFVLPQHKAFDYISVVDFCRQRGIAIFDTASQVRRLRNNASDSSLEIVHSTDIPLLLSRIPDCHAVVATGLLAAQTICQTIDTEPPKVGNSIVAQLCERQIRLYRMPSSSRAYPLSFEQKTEAYRRMFLTEGIL